MNKLLVSLLLLLVCSAQAGELASVKPIPEEEKKRIASRQKQLLKGLERLLEDDIPPDLLDPALLEKIELLKSRLTVEE